MPVPRLDASAAERFRQSYNRNSLLFEHDLTDDPLFSQPSLFALASRHPRNPAYAHWSNGTVSVGDRWEAGAGARRSLPDTIGEIEVNDSLAMIKHLEEDVAFGPLVRKIHATILDLVGPRMRDDVIIGRGTILIASPRRVTSFHIDSDVNYLFQISGTKMFSVFDQTDRTLTTHQELERYYSGDPNGAVFPQGRQRDAITYELRAGFGVHVPCMAAHWAQNLDAPSVALSINFDLRSVTTLGRIYRMNDWMRRHGLRPQPPGTSPWHDGLKLAALSGLDAARRIVKRRPASQ